MTLLSDPSAAFTTSGHKNLYVSQCNICGFGVFQTQKWAWSRRPLGICHSKCVEAKGGAR